MFHSVAISFVSTFRPMVGVDPSCHPKPPRTRVMSLGERRGPARKMAVRLLATMSIVATVGGRYSNPSRAPCAFSAFEIVPFSRCVARAISRSQGTAHPRAGRVPRMMLPDEDGWLLNGARFSENVRAEQVRVGWLRGGGAATTIMSGRGSGKRRAGGAAGALDREEVEGADSVQRERKEPRGLTPEQIQLARQFITPEIVANV